MKCVFCENELTKDIQTIERRVNNHLVYIKNVPVDLCKFCGEVYIDDIIVIEMNNILKCIKSKSLYETVLIDFDCFKEMGVTLDVDKPTFVLNNRLVTI